MSSDAQDRRIGEAERSMDRTAREMEEHGERLERDIDAARHGGDDVHDAQQIPGFAGDWHEEHDRAGGDDPKGALGGGDDDRDDDASRGGTRRG